MGPISSVSTCRMPFSAQKQLNQTMELPNPNATLTSAVAMRPPANSFVGDDRAPSTPDANLEKPYLQQSSDSVSGYWHIEPGTAVCATPCTACVLDRKQPDSDDKHREGDFAQCAADQSRTRWGRWTS